MIYAVLNEEGKCVNRVLWDGTNTWSPPEGHIVIPDLDGKYPIAKSEQIEEDVV